MALFKVQGCYCLSLAHGCFILGLLDFGWIVLTLVTSGLQLKSSDNFSTKLRIVIDGIALITCVLMVAGSETKKRFLIVPHILCRMIMMLYVSIEGTRMIINKFASNYWEGFLYLFVLVIILVAIAHFCTIMYSRFGEIKEDEKSAPTETEME